MIWVGIYRTGNFIAARAADFVIEFAGPLAKGVERAGDRAGTGLDDSISGKRSGDGVSLRIMRSLDAGEQEIRKTTIRRNPSRAARSNAASTRGWRHPERRLGPANPMPSHSMRASLAMLELASGSWCRARRRPALHRRAACSARLRSDRPPTQQFLSIPNPAKPHIDAGIVGDETVHLQAGRS